MRRRRGEAGFISVEYAVAIGLLLIPIGLLVITMPSWPERQTIGRVAAEEAARVAALADNADEAAYEGEAIALQVVSNWGLDDEDVADIDISTDGAFGRGAQVRATVVMEMPALAIPGFGVFNGWSWTAEHTEVVDQYRSFES